MILAIYIIKYLTILFCCFYAFSKCSCEKIKATDLILILPAAALSLALYYVTVYVKIIIPVLLLVLITVIFKIRFRRPLTETLTISTISLGITILTMAIATLVCYPLGLALYLIKDAQIREFVMRLVNSAIHTSACLGFFRIKRFGKSIVYMKNDGTYGRFVYAAIVCIFGMTLFYSRFMSENYLEFIFVFVVFCALSLLIWWRKLISSDYETVIAKRNAEIAERALECTKTESAAINAHNEDMAKLIHRDSKLLKALLISVRQLAENNPDDPAAKDVLRQIQDLQADESQAVTAAAALSSDIPKTEIITLDAIFDYLDARTRDIGVEFSFEFDETALKELLAFFPDQTDLNTLLCDLGENALIAAKGGRNGRVKAVIDTEGGAPCAKFFDNGALFDEKVVAELGRSKVTTHSTDGGSGIGLMTACEILRRAEASFEIDEISDNVLNGGFTKCVIVKADRLNGRRLRSRRESVKKICDSRSDLTYIEN